jgi:DNA-binding YbaB/EbfC family protein
MAKGFKGSKGSNPMGMMKQLQQMQEQLLEAQARLAEETVTGTAGGGAVKVTLTGDQKCTGIEIDPALLEDPDIEMIQDLLLTATNNALEASRGLAQDRLGPLTSGLSF